MIERAEEEKKTGGQKQRIKPMGAGLFAHHY
jgi:hypothetical protein